MPQRRLGVFFLSLIVLGVGWTQQGKAVAQGLRQGHSHQKAHLVPHCLEAEAGSELELSATDQQPLHVA